MELGELIARCFYGAFGSAFAVGAFAFMWYRHSWRWRRLASVYPAGEQSPADVRLYESILLFGDGVAFNSYQGIARLGVQQGGLELRLFGPFAAFHSPILIPYDEVSVTPTVWYLNTKSFKITASGAPEIEIVVAASIIDWIEQNATQHWPGSASFDSAAGFPAV